MTQQQCKECGGRKGKWMHQDTNYEEFEPCKICNGTGEQKLEQQP